MVLFSVDYVGVVRIVVPRGSFVLFVIIVVVGGEVSIKRAGLIRGTTVARRPMRFMTQNPFC